MYTSTGSPFPSGWWNRGGDLTEVRSADAASGPPSTSEGDGRDDLVSRSSFLQACRGCVPKRHPVWLMRQAGRILEPYRRLKEKTGSLLTLFRTPDLAAEISLMPVEMLHVDAAILFADILTPVDPMGCPVSFQPGPVMSPIRTRGDVEALRIIDSETDLSYVSETISLILPALPADVPLIGFAGSPFTLACDTTNIV